MARILDRHTSIINNGSAKMAHGKDEHGVRDRARRRLVLVDDELGGNGWYKNHFMSAMFTTPVALYE
jgi:hypothetical protein